MTWYILDENRKPVLADMLEANQWLIDNPDMKQVERTQVGSMDVSTVFLSLDHAWGGPPLIYETMVFGGALDLDQRRYSTEEEALIGHAEIVNLCKMEIQFSEDDES